MPEILQYDFMMRAFLAGLVAAITLPVIGSFLVARRYSLIADGLAHVSLAGVGAGLLFGVAPFAIAVPFAALGAIGLEWLRQNRRLSGDVGLAILMSGGLAVALVLSTLARGSATRFDTYLFGSIATTTPGDVLLLVCASIAALIIILINYRALVHITYNEDGARIAGYSVKLINYLLAVMTAVIVVLSLRIVGGLLISALLVVPVVTASQLARSFMQTILMAIGVAIIAMLAGLIVAFYAGIAAGGSIVLSSLVLLALALIWRK